MSTHFSLTAAVKEKCFDVSKKVGVITCLFNLALQTCKIKATLEYAIVNLKPPKLYTIVVCCPSVCIHRYILTADLQSDELIIFFSPLWLS